MSDFVIMPKKDYQDICNIVREKTGETDLIKSGELMAKIDSISGGIQDISSEVEMDALLVEENISKIYRFTGESTTKYVQGDLYMVEEIE